MASKLPYNSLPNLGDLQEGDIVPVLRPPFQEGSATISNFSSYVRPYDFYIASVTQSGTNNPSVTIFENTIGSIAWTYDSVGNYLGTLTGAFPGGTLAFFINNTRLNSICKLSRIDDDTILLACNITDSVPFSPTNDMLENATIEIRRYNIIPA